MREAREVFVATLDLCPSSQLLHEALSPCLRAKAFVSLLRTGIDQGSLVPNPQEVAHETCKRCMENHCSPYCRWSNDLSTPTDCFLQVAVGGGEDASRKLVSAYGSNRAPIGKHNLGDFWFFNLFFNVCYCICGVYIIPKWLIKVPGHFGILFGWFRELRQFH